MEWSDDAIVLSVRPHGETCAIVESADPYARPPRRNGAGRGIAQPQTDASARQHAAACNGARACPSISGISRSNRAFARGRHAGSGDALAGLNAFASVATAALPEREPHENVFHAAEILLDAIAQDDFAHWAPLYVRWEAGLLEALGFGLDLSRCAATGSLDDLVYVSPKSGRAVSAGAGAAYRERLFALPAFLLGSQNANLRAPISRQGCV